MFEYLEISGYRWSKYIFIDTDDIEDDGHINGLEVDHMMNEYDELDEESEEDADTMVAIDEAISNNDTDDDNSDQ